MRKAPTGQNSREEAKDVGIVSDMNHQQMLKATNRGGSGRFIVLPTNSRNIQYDMPVRLVTRGFRDVGLDVGELLKGPFGLADVEMALYCPNSSEYPYHRPGTPGTAGGAQRLCNGRLDLT